MNTTHGIKTELVPADRAGDVLEKALKIRNPELWKARRESFAKQLAKARKEGKTPPVYPWRPRHGYGGRVSNPLQSLGLTALNRPFSEARADLYAEEMLAGRWYTSPDPIVISKGGYVINGQHRLVAASMIRWEEGDEIPLFLVVWGFDEKTALLMDEAKRNTTDRRAIALGYATALTNQKKPEPATPEQPVMIGGWSLVSE
jgi:hypothetical protein